MTFDEWLDGERGRLTMVADHFGVTPSAVSQWRANGVPVRLIPVVHELTNSDVPLEELVRRPKRSEHEAAA